MRRHRRTLLARIGITFVFILSLIAPVVGTAQTVDTNTFTDAGQHVTVSWSDRWGVSPNWTPEQGFLVLQIADSSYAAITYDDAAYWPVEDALWEYWNPNSEDLLDDRSEENPPFITFADENTTYVSTAYTINDGSTTVNVTIFTIPMLIESVLEIAGDEITINGQSALLAATIDSSDNDPTDLTPALTPRSGRGTTTTTTEVAEATVVSDSTPMPVTPLTPETEPGDNMATYHGDNFTTAFDMNIWTMVGDSIRGGDAENLSLTKSTALLSLAFNTNYGTDVEACLADKIEIVGEYIGANHTIAIDENGDPVQSLDPVDSWAVLLFDSASADGHTVAFVNCEQLPGSDGVMVYTLLSRDAATYNDDLDDALDIVFNVEGTTPIVTPAEGGSTDTPDTSITEYRGESYDFSFQVDPEIWSLNNSFTSRGDTDGFGFDHEDALLYIVVRDGSRMDLATCINTEVLDAQLLTSLDSRMEAIDSAGDPLRYEAETDAWAVYTFDYVGDDDDTETWVEFNLCQLAPGSSVLVMMQLLSPLADYDANLDFALDIFDTLSFGDPVGSQKLPAINRLALASSQKISDGGTAVAASQRLPTSTTSDEGFYEGVRHGYTVNYDPDIWTVNRSFDEADAEGIRLGNDSSTLLIIAWSAYGSDVVGCVDGEAGFYETSNSVSEFSPVLNDDGTPLRSERDNLAWGVYSYTFTGDRGTSSPMVDFYLCMSIPGQDAVVMIELLSRAESYNDNLDLVQAVVDSVEFTGQSLQTIDTTPEVGPSTDTAITYNGELYNYSFTYDSDFWYITPITGEDGMDGLQMESSLGLLTIMGWNAYGTDIEACLDGEFDFNSQQPGITDMTPATDANGDIIRTVEDDQGWAGYNYTYTNSSGNAVAWADFYVCTAIPGADALLIAELMAPMDTYSDHVNESFDVIDTAIFGDAVEMTEEETNTYTSPTYGFTVSYDADAFVVEDASDTDGIEGISLNSPEGTIYLLAWDGYGADVEACANGEAEYFGKADGVSDVEPLLNPDGNEVRGAIENEAWFAHSYLYTDEQGNTGYWVSLYYCVGIPDQDAIFMMEIMAPDETYNDLLDPALDSLDSLDFGEQDVTHVTWEGLLYGYTTLYDANYWERADTLSGDGFDGIILVHGTDAVLVISGWDGYGNNVQACLNGEASYYSTGSNIDNWQVVNDTTGNTADFARGEYTYLYTDKNGNTNPYHDIYTCMAIPGSDAVVIIELMSNEAAFTESSAKMQEVLDAVRFAEASTPAAPMPTSEPQTDPAETPATRPDDSDVLTYLDATAYTSPNFGYSVDIPLEWDIYDETSEAGNDVLVVGNGKSIITFWATTDYSGSVAGCVDFAAEESGLNLEMDMTSDGADFRGSFRGVAYGQFNYVDEDGSEWVYFINCRAIGDTGAYLILTQDVSTFDFSTERRPRTNLEDSIIMP